MKKRNYFLVWFILMGIVCCTTVCLQAAVKDQLLEKCRHLEEYSYFKKYNQNHYFNNFTISETWRGGKPFYQLSSEEGIDILINKKQTKATVTYLGKEVSFTINGFLNTNANVYLMDLTNDGLQELIYEEFMSGEDGSMGTCIIIDLIRMERIDTEDFLNTLLDNISVEVVETDTEKTLCKITDSNHHIYFGYLDGASVNGEQKREIEYDYYAMELDLIHEKVRAYICFTLSGCNGETFLGDVSSFFDYDAQNQSFVLQDDYKVTLWDPM